MKFPIIITKNTKIVAYVSLNFINLIKILSYLYNFLFNNLKYHFPAFLEFLFSLFSSRSSFIYSFSFFSIPQTSLNQSHALFYIHIYYNFFPHTYKTPMRIPAMRIHKICKHEEVRIW